MAGYGPQMAVNDIIEVQLWSTSGDQAAVNVLHYKVTAIAGAGLNSLDLIVAGMDTLGVSAALKALMSSQAAFNGYGIRRYVPNPSINYYDITGAGAGTVAGDLLPRQIAGFIRKKSAVPGRRKSGRVYVPFPGEDDNQSSQIPTAGYFTRLQVLRTALFSQVQWAAAAGSATPIILKRGVGNPPVGWEARDIDTMPVVQRWATQRRRGNFGRKNQSPV